jgi:alpha-tubulin suppressor-like RCC1 family protein
MYQIDSRFSAQKLLWATQMQTNRTDTTFVFYNRDVSDFAISDWNTCFISAGTVYCSGYNNLGQLGQGHFNGPDGLPSIAPGDAATAASKIRSIEWAAPVGGLLAGKTAVAIVGGNNHFCVTTSEKDVYCWGDNSYGQLGDGTTTNRPSPVKASTPRTIVY